jgi:hypothetical protein
VRGVGTLVNVAAVIAGCVAGLLAGARLPERIRATILNGVGLLVLGIGLQEFLGTRNAVFPLVSVVLGGVVGEALRIEDRLQGVGERIRRRVGGHRATTGTFAEAFSTASLTFCVGPLTILGSLQDGLGAGAQLLLVKAALDGLISIIYAATLGVGVMASALTVAVVQGALTGIGAFAGRDVLDARMVIELTATGGVMIAGLGLRLLHIKEIRVGSYLPGLVIAPIAVALFAR